MKKLQMLTTAMALLFLVFFGCHKQVKTENSQMNQTTNQTIRVYVADMLEIPVERVSIEGNYIYIENTDVKMQLDSIKELYIKHLEYKKHPTM